MFQIKESDWKLFKKVKENALERFCADVLSDIKEALENETDSFHDKYLYVYEFLQNSDKRLSLLFDKHSRSNAAIQLMLLRREGLVNESELEGMSDEFLKSTAPRK